jgi:hypothetical protein
MIDNNVWSDNIFVYLEHSDYFSVLTTSKSFHDNLKKNNSFAYCKNVIHSLNKYCEYKDVEDIDNDTKELCQTNVSEFVDLLYLRVTAGSRIDTKACAKICKIITESSIEGFQDYLLQILDEKISADEYFYFEHEGSPPPDLEQRFKRKHLTTLSFIGELYVQRVVVEEQITLILEELLNEFGVTDFLIEQAYELLLVTGKLMDSNYGSEQMDCYYSILSSVGSKGSECDCIIREKVKQLLSMRENGWE